MKKEGKKEGRKEGRKEGSKEGKEGKKEGGGKAPIRIWFHAICELKMMVKFQSDTPASKSVILKNDLLLVLKKMTFCFDTKSKCQYDGEGTPSKTVISKMT